MYLFLYIYVPEEDVEAPVSIWFSRVQSLLSTFWMLFFCLSTDDPTRSGWLERFQKLSVITNQSYLIKATEIPFRLIFKSKHNILKVSRPVLLLIIFLAFIIFRCLSQRYLSRTPKVTKMDLFSMFFFSLSESK